MTNQSKSTNLIFILSIFNDFDKLIGSLYLILLKKKSKNNH